MRYIVYQDVGPNLGTFPVLAYRMNPNAQQLTRPGKAWAAKVGRARAILQTSIRMTDAAVWIKSQQFVQLAHEPELALGWWGDDVFDGMYLQPEALYRVCRHTGKCTQYTWNGERGTYIPTSACPGGEPCKHQIAAGMYIQREKLQVGFDEQFMAVMSYWERTSRDKFKRGQAGKQARRDIQKARVRSFEREQVGKAIRQARQANLERVPAVDLTRVYLPDGRPLAKALRSGPQLVVYEVATPAGLKYQFRRRVTPESAPDTLAPLIYGLGAALQLVDVVPS